MVANATPVTPEEIQKEKEAKAKRALELKGALIPTQNPVESGGIAWTEVFTQRGSKINLTSRADNPIDALENLYVAIEYALSVKGCVPERTYPTLAQTLSAPSTPVASATANAVNQAPALPTGSDIEIIEVKTIAHTATPNGVHNITVKGGKYSKYGVSAWKEVLPDDISAIYQTWPIGQEFEAPANMKKAMVGTNSSGKGKRVITFSV